MKTPILLLPLILTGCTTLDGGECPDVSDLRSNIDLTPPTAKCAAAKGLTGEALTCIDFTQLTSLTDPKLTGWDFTVAMGTCPGWDLSTSKLQVKNFTGFTGSCGFQMPPLTDPDYAKYTSFTLSVIHTVDLNKQQQTALIYLGRDQDTQQLSFSSGLNPKMISTFQVAKAALPNGGSGKYQPLFKLTSGQIFGGAGWQIESIAILGHTQ
jgi:hypothetical protein